MPRLRETPEQTANRLFRAAFAAGMVRQELTQTEIAAKLHVSGRTISSYKSAPDKITVAKLRRLYKAGVLTADDVTAFVCV